MGCDGGEAHFPWVLHGVLGWRVAQARHRVQVDSLAVCEIAVPRHVRLFDDGAAVNSPDTSKKGAVLLRVAGSEGGGMV